MNPHGNIPRNKSTETMNVTSFDCRLLSLMEKHFNFGAKRIIANDALWNVTDNKNHTLLHYAAEYDNAEIVDYLLGSGSKVDARNDLGQTPLMIAALKSYWGPTIEILIKGNANIYSGHERNMSALRLCSDRKFVSKTVIKLFQERLENDCSKDKEEIAYRLFHGRWPLPKIIQLEDPEMMKIMLQLGYVDQIGIDGVENNDLGYTALHIAVMNVDVGYVKILVEYKANLVKDSDGRTPLSYVYDYYSKYKMEKRLDILKMLLARIGQAHIDPGQSRNIFEYGNEAAIKLILQSNINLMSKISNQNKNTSVHILAKNENPGTIKQLQNQRFDVDKRNNWGETPLIVAATSGNVEAVEFLLNAGAEIDAVNANGRTALFEILDRRISEERFRDCVQALLEAGANVQMPIAGRAVLHTIWCTKKLVLGDLVLAHLALQGAQGIPITQIIHVAINSLARFGDFFKLSRQQLNTKVYGGKTLINLLTESDHQLQACGRVEGFALKIEDFISTLTDKSYYYSTLLKKRIEKVRLRQRSAHVICKIMGTSYKRFPLIADNIASYLELLDMKNLMDAFRITEV